MDSTPSKLSFGISYGFTGGSLHSRTLRKLMMEAGFTPVRKEVADIIIAHSAGCWLIPENISPKLVLYVGMPLANEKPFRTWRKAVVSGTTNNPRRLTAKTNSKNAFYGISQPWRNFNIVRSAATAVPIIFKNTPTIFIANRYDPWPQGDCLNKYVDTKNWTFIGLPGSHNNIWNHPKSYVEIVKRYAELLD